MNAKQAFEKMMAARDRRLKDLMAPVMRDVAEAVEKGDGYCFATDLSGDVVEELKHREFVVAVVAESRNETTWRIEWPRPR